MSAHVRFRGGRSFGGLQGSLSILAALACIAAAAGVVSQPAVELERARSRRAVLERAVRGGEECRVELAAFDEAQGAERLASARTRALGAFPFEPSALDQHAALRVLARRHGIELGALRFSEDVDLELDGPDDRVVRRAVHVTGRATIGVLVEFVDELVEAGAIGAPAHVLEARVARDDPGDATFEFALTLALLHAAEPRARASWEEGP